MIRSTSRFQGLGRCLLSVLLVIGSVPAFPQAAYQPTETEVKAAFLYHFAQLVTWPEEADPATPITIAIVGPDPFGPKLETTIGGQTVRGRALRIVRAASVTEIAGPAHIVFIGFKDRAECERSLTSLTKAPSLTVSSTTGFAKRGGMIEFRLTADERVSFDINVQAAGAAGLKMSSQLLKIARVVETAR